MLFTTISKNGVIIRLPKERWKHIIARHSALVDQQPLVLATITEPESILDGNKGALMAIRILETGKVLVVVYKEISNNDGFVITAFPTRHLNLLIRRTPSICPLLPALQNALSVLNNSPLLVFSLLKIAGFEDDPFFHCRSDCSNRNSIWFLEFPGW